MSRPFITVVSLALLLAADVSAFGDQSKSQHPSSQAPRVLDPGKFFGKTRSAYKCCQTNTQLAKKLFCYCGCDVSEEHKCLLDCYTAKDQHAASCVECIEEMLKAGAMHGQGKPLRGIQCTLHERWAKHYPFSEPSPVYKEYLAKTQLQFSPSKESEPAPKKPDSEPEESAVPEEIKAPTIAIPKHDTQQIKPKKPPRFEFPPDGPKTIANAAVEKYPGLMSKLECYCGCATSQEHESLMDCFTSNESPECSICMEEAAIAGKMHADGATDEAIKKLLKETYSQTPAP